MCEETKPDRADIGAWRKGTRKAYCVGDPCRRRRHLRNGAVLCGGTDHSAASCGAKCVCRLFAVAYAALVGFLLRTVLYNGAHGISHTATFAILKTIRQKIIEKTTPFAARNGRGYAKRHAQGYHRRPCGQHGNDSCVPVSRNDGESCRAAFDGRLPVCFG